MVSLFRTPTSSPHLSIPPGSGSSCDDGRAELPGFCALAGSHSIFFSFQVNACPATWPSRWVAQIGCPLCDLWNVLFQPLGLSQQGPSLPLGVSRGETLSNVARLRQHGCFFSVLRLSVFVLRLLFRRARWSWGFA